MMLASDFTPDRNSWLTLEIPKPIAAASTMRCGTMIDYSTPLYKISQAAEAAAIPVNTLRSYYAKGDFRIIGGEDKKGRGSASLLTLTDVMCIAVAVRLVEIGVHARPAFEAAMHFAYAGYDDRLPAQMATNSKFTMFLFWAASGESAVIGTDDGLDFAQLFAPVGRTGRHAPIVLLLNDVERRVFWALLRPAEPDFTL